VNVQIIETWPGVDAKVAAADGFALIDRLGWSAVASH
jgi:hypothetical protein